MSAYWGPGNIDWNCGRWCDVEGHLTFGKNLDGKIRIDILVWMLCVA